MLRTLAILTLVAVLATTTVAAEKEDPVGDALNKMKDKSQPTRLAGVADAARLQDPKITTQLIKLLKDKDWHVRQLSVEALRVRTGDSEQKKAALALAGRLSSLAKATGMADECTQTIGALSDLARRETVKSLLDFDHETPEDIAKARLLAAANAPYPETVDELIKFLSKGRNKGRSNQRNLAAVALRHVTGVNLGHDPDKWRSWWKDNRATFSLKAVKEEREEKARAAEEKARKKEEQRAERERKKKERQEGRKKKPKKEEREGPPD